MSGDMHGEPADSAEYLAWAAEMDAMCRTSFTTGGHDPYGTYCELPNGHKGSHRGPDPMGAPGDGGTVEWDGGGMCAGDPLPQRNVRWNTG